MKSPPLVRVRVRVGVRVRLRLGLGLGLRVRFRVGVRIGGNLGELHGAHRDDGEGQALEVEDLVPG